MYILRLEDSHGQGIYASSVAHTIASNMGDNNVAHDTRGAHPMPENDSLLRKNGYNSLKKYERSHVYGFYGYGQFRAWFFSDEFLRCAAEYDIYLSVYRVPDEYVIVGNSQCIFNRKYAELVVRFDPDISREDFEKKLLDTSGN